MWYILDPAIIYKRYKFIVLMNDFNNGQRNKKATFIKTFNYCKKHKIDTGFHHDLSKAYEQYHKFRQKVKKIISNPTFHEKIKKSTP